MSSDDRAKVLVDSPHAGKLINRVPFYWVSLEYCVALASYCSYRFLQYLTIHHLCPQRLQLFSYQSGGYGTGIRKSAEPAAKDLMWDFFVYVNTPITSVDDVVLPSWLDSWRHSQLSDYERNFQQGGWSFDAWNEHQKIMLWALGNDVNSALTLRLPGVLTYSRDVVLDKFQDYMAGLISMEDLKATVTQGWNDATTVQGKLNQVQIYRASLGQDPLTESDMCRLHREEMDNEDNTVCTKYDPKSSDESRTILIAVLVPVLAIIFAGTIIWLYLERKRRHADAIWMIDKKELKFADPPEIAGRGTFGLVVKAEYRGTDVAVKRVIPPKDRINRSGLLLGAFDKNNKNSAVVSFDEEKILRRTSNDDPKASRRASDESTAVRKSSLDLISRKSSMDHIFESEKNGTSDDLEAGFKKTLSKKGSLQSIVSSVSSNDEIGTHSGTGMSSSQMASFKKWFGYKSIKGGSEGKKYDRLKKEFVAEMRTVSKLRHPCVVTVMGSVIDTKEEPLLIMEFMDNGSLYDLLHNASIVIDGELIFPILSDIVRGARFLHAADPAVIHGDLKAANVLVDARFRAKISGKFIDC